jgi:hypothetical protein
VSQAIWVQAGIVPIVPGLVQQRRAHSDRFHQVMGQALDDFAAPSLVGLAIEDALAICQ